MHPSDDALINSFTSSLQDIELLYERGRIQSVLVLLYSAVDAAAWLDVSGEADVTKVQFESWVDSYLLPNSNLACSATELYAARCGVLHSLVAVSRLSRERAVRTLSYAYGAATVQNLIDTCATLGRTDVVGVHVGDLISALKAGMQRFIDDAVANTARWENIRSRASKHFSLLPTEEDHGVIVIFRNSARS